MISRIELRRSPDPQAADDAEGPGRVAADVVVGCLPMRCAEWMRMEMDRSSAMKCLNACSRCSGAWIGTAMASLTQTRLMQVRREQIAQRKRNPQRHSHRRARRVSRM